MNQKTYLSTAGAVFLVVAVLHLLRALSGGLAYVAGWAVPVWVSWVAFIIAGFLAYWGFKLSK